MTDSEKSVVLKSTQDASVLELSLVGIEAISGTGNQVATIFRARFVDPGIFNCSGEIKTSTEFSGPPSELFVRMAEQWRGWDGELCWESSDGPNGLLTLVSRCDSLGHICITVKLRDFLDKFRLQGEIWLEAGQLDEVAFKMKNLFQPDSNE